MRDSWVRIGSDPCITHPRVCPKGLCCTKANERTNLTAAQTFMTCVPNVRRLAGGQARHRMAFDGQQGQNLPIVMMQRSTYTGEQVSLSTVENVPFHAAKIPHSFEAEVRRKTRSNAPAIH